MILLDPDQKEPVSDLLVEVLVCPKDQADLRLDGEELVCLKCGSRYPIEDGIPNMLINRR